MTNARRQIGLPEELCALAEQRFTPRFDNLEALIEYILRDLTQNDVETLDQAEHAILEKRLRDLGYI